MFDAFFIGDARWFGVPALFGTALFLIRLTLMLVGGDADTDMDGGVDSDGGDVGDDSGDAFTILSVQSVAAFAMGFGWAGLGSLNGAGWSTTTAMVVGAAGGVAMVWLLAILLRGMHDLQSSGTLSARNALGKPGDVESTVPGHKQGLGRVRVVIDNRQRSFDAVTDGDELPTRSRIQVVGVDGDNTLVVTSA